MAGICVFCQIFLKNQSQRDKIILFCTLVSVLFFNVFKDWKNMDDICDYVPTFEYIARPNSNYLNASSYYKMQIGFYYLNKIIALFSSSKEWFLFVMGCITCIPYLFIIKKYSPIIWLSCLIYFMGFSMSTYVLRQYSAIGLTILAFPLLLKIDTNNTKKQINLLLGILSLWVAAILIHPTAIVFGLLIASYFIKDNKIFLLLLIIGSFILYFGLPYLTLAFVENTSGYQNYMDETNADRGGTFILNGFYLASTFFVFISQKKKHKSIDSVLRLLFKCQCLIFAFTLVSMMPMGSTIPRLLLYLSCFNVIFIPYLAANMPNKLMKYLFIICVLFISYYQFALSPNIHIYNYNIIHLNLL